MDVLHPSRYYLTYSLLCLAGAAFARHLLDVDLADAEREVVTMLLYSTSGASMILAAVFAATQLGPVPLRRWRATLANMVFEPDDETRAGNG